MEETETMTTTDSSRARAVHWPYSRHKIFEKKLRDAASVWFRGQKAIVHPKMSYCLDSLTNWKKNIILPDVADFLEHYRLNRDQHDAFPLHKYAHHGLSSQAMLFNLVGPLMLRKDIEAIRPAFENAGVPWPSEALEPTLEFEDRKVFNEDVGQPTSIDFAVHGDNGAAPLFIEAKLVEREFGGCSVFAAGDCDGMNPLNDLEGCYLHHIGRRYWSVVEEFGLSSIPTMQGAICPFTVHYQFYRELLFALAKEGHFVLLHDERNPVFVNKHRDGGPVRGLWPFLTAGLSDEVRNQIHRVTIQDVITAIEQTHRHDDWTGIFRDKYDLQLQGQ